MSDPVAVPGTWITNETADRVPIHLADPLPDVYRSHDLLDVGDEKVIVTAWTADRKTIFVVPYEGSTRQRFDRFREWWEREQSFPMEERMQRFFDGVSQPPR